MKHGYVSRWAASLAVLALLALPLVVAGAPKPAAKPSATPAAPASAPATSTANTKLDPNTFTHPKLKGWINGVPDTGQFLADSVWLLRVGPRVNTVGDFITRWFAAYPPDRPNQDSVGRVQFLSSMRDRDVLALTAKEKGKPLGFEDRHELRQARQRALVTELHDRFVMDSVKVTEDQVRELYESYKWDQHLRHILVADRNTAEGVRREIQSGRITWSAAVKKYSLASATKEKDGDLGWMERSKMDVYIANIVFQLKPGEIAVPVKDGQGWHVVQSVDRKARPALAYQSIRRKLRAELVNQQTGVYTERLTARIREQEQLKFDTLNCAFASQKFRVAVDVQSSGLGGTINVDETVPEFAEADTARLLAKWRNGGRYSIGDLVHAYSDIPPLLRPSLNVPEIIMAFVESSALEPALAEYAVSQGLEQAPYVQASIAKKTEELMVGHLYQDSVARYVWVSKDERKAYYQKHLAQFHTYPKVRFAAITRTSKAGVDSVVQALKSGVKAQAILAADSAGGHISGSIQERSQADQGAYQAALFNEMRAGDYQVRGPDREGVYVVIQSLEYDPGRQLSYEESETMIDESLQNMKTDAALRAFIDRHQRRYATAWRPELVTLIKLVDPSLSD